MKLSGQPVSHSGSIVPASESGMTAMTSAVKRNGYDLQFHVTPNRAAQNNDFALSIKRNGRPVTGAGVTATFAMLDMEMGQQAYALKETAPGVYSHSAPALVMVGHWALTFEVQPPTGSDFVLLTDHVFVGHDAAGGGTDLDASRTYNLVPTLRQNGFNPQPQQGYHVKLTVHTDGSQGADVKHKVFWVQPCTSSS